MVLATCMLNENILVTAMIPHIKHNLFEFLYRLLSGLSYREITHIIKFMKQYKNWIIEITLNHAIKVSKYSESKLGIIKKNAISNRNQVKINMLLATRKIQDSTMQSFGTQIHSKMEKCPKFPPKYIYFHTTFLQ